jgi:microsomal dipeptidase-like Zn-dependent dipeptidase
MRTTAILLLLGAARAHAETAVPVTSCAAAEAVKNAYAQCVSWPPPFNSFCTPPDIQQCWDFEAGLGAWTTSGTAFSNQPTFGDNVTAWRVLQGRASPTGTSVLGDVSAIGGDYWQSAVPIGHQGLFWLGTQENRPTAQSPWGGSQGDGPTGSAYSPSFYVDRDYVSFLVGGGCSDATRVELQVLEPDQYVCRPGKLGGPVICHWFPAMWRTAVGAFGAPLSVHGTCHEELERELFFTGAGSGLQGRIARVAAIDDASGSWGHVNLDHVLHANTVPNDVDGANVPLWGIADTHAHFDAESAMRGASGMPLDGHILHGSVGTVTTDRTLLASQLGSCDSRGHGTNTTAIAVLQKLEGASLGSSPGFPLGCFTPSFGGLPYSNQCTYPGFNVPFNKPTSWDWSSAQAYEHFGEGVVPSGNDLVGWPYWYTRTHQQMHLTWVKRAYQSGQRLMVAAAVNNELLGMTMRQSHLGDYLSDYGALRLFARNMKAIASANASWMEIAYTPADARRIVRSNKLAIVLATEVDDLGDHCAGDFVSQATTDPMDRNGTITTEGADPWNQLRDRTRADSCKTEAQWRTRVDNLYKVGYRVVIPVHLTDNDLGGTAAYSDLFNTASQFVTGAFLSVMPSADVSFLFAETPNSPMFANVQQGGWTRLGNLRALPAYGPAIVDAGPIVYPYPADRATNMAAPGFINIKSLTYNGLMVIDALKQRGMVIDIAHLDQRGRDQVLGLKGLNTSSPLNSNCDLATPACQQSAYPVISSHAGFRDLQPARETTGGGKDEAALRGDQIDRIRALGGTVAVGVSAGDTVDVNTAAPGSIWSELTIPSVANSCGGSSRSFAQSYIYALRHGGEKGITLGTDFNGLEDRLNPRFGMQACYGRGNIPWSAQLSWDSSRWLVNYTSKVPIKYRPSIIGRPDGTAGAQRDIQRRLTFGLRYQHYNGTPPIGGRAMGLLDPPDYAAIVAGLQFQNITPGTFTIDSMQQLPALPAITASVTGNRTFDFNYDGYAHYGMLPDMLQDVRTVGMQPQQLAPLFRGAESFVATWEKGCRLGNPSQNSLGCGP